MVTTITTTTTTGLPPRTTKTSYVRFGLRGAARKETIATPLTATR